MFTVLRAITALFKTDDDANLGLYGAFGYDLAFQFEPLDYRLERQPSQRDLVLYLPDELLVVDHTRQGLDRPLRLFRRGAFDRAACRATGPSRSSPPTARRRAATSGPASTPGWSRRRWSVQARRPVRGRARPDLLERCPGAASEIFRRLQERNPSPYGFLINLGEGEYLVGASPEMYVRVDGRRVETCPISGTIARGDDPIGDAEQILDAAQLGQGRVRADHVHRRRPQRQVAGLRAGLGAGDRPPPDRDVLAADPHRRPRRGPLREGSTRSTPSSAHAWAVTVTGAPKAWAMQFIEDHERKSPRAGTAAPSAWSASTATSTPA